MEPVYVVINQLGQYLNKHKAFISGRDNQLVYRTVHKDEALNQVFEMSSKDIDLRARVLSVELDEKGQPLIEPGPQSEYELEKAAGHLAAQDADENVSENDSATSIMDEEPALEETPAAAEKTDENQNADNNPLTESATPLETEQNAPTY